MSSYKLTVSPTSKSKSLRTTDSRVSRWRYALESSKASPRSQTMESTRKGARESAEIAFTRGTAGMAGIASAKAKERATPAKTLKKENITAGKDNSNKLYLARGGG